MDVLQREGKMELGCPDMDLGAHKVVLHIHGRVGIDLYRSVEVRADGNWAHNYYTYFVMGYTRYGFETSAHKEPWSVTCPYYLGCIWAAAGLNIPGWAMRV